MLRRSFFSNGTNANLSVIKKDNLMLQKIVSGGQTGVDRAAFDVANSIGLDFGGYCPQGGEDEKGIIPEKYRTHMKEVSGEFKTDKENRDARTKKNIQESCGTLIIYPEFPIPKEITDGTMIMKNEAESLEKPFLEIYLSNSIDFNSKLIADWVKNEGIKVLNIGGPRESSWPGIFQSSFELLSVALPQCKPSVTLRSNL